MSGISPILKEQLGEFVKNLFSSGLRGNGLQPLAEKQSESHYKGVYIVLGVIIFSTIAMYFFVYSNYTFIGGYIYSLDKLIVVSSFLLFVLISILVTCVKICKMEKQKQDIYCKLYEAELKNNQYKIGEMVSLYKRMIEISSEGEAKIKETLEECLREITDKSESKNNR